MRKVGREALRGAMRMAKADPVRREWIESKLQDEPWKTSRCLLLTAAKSIRCA
jgi:hypothetical protein